MPTDDRRSLDATPLSPSVALPPLEAYNLPLPCGSIASHCLADCAARQVAFLEEQSSTSLLTDREEDALDDGFFLCDLRTVHTKLAVWRTMFPNVKPFFALKCHPDPMLACLLGQSGAAGFDCASAAEIELALKSTNHDTRLVLYANPQRAEEALVLALQRGVRVLTFDGAEELRKVYRLYRQVVAECNTVEANIDNPPQMVLRILVPDEHSTVQLGEKFGAPPDQWKNLVQLAVQLHLPVVGVSFHCGSGNDDPDSYVQAIALACEAMQCIEQVQTHLKPWLLDIGGGYPGVDGWGGDDHRFTNKPRVTETLWNGEMVQTNATKLESSTAKIAEAVRPVLAQLVQEHDDWHFVAEPGRYFVEAAFALCSRIYKKYTTDDHNGDKDGKRRHYYIAHGVQGVFKDTLLCGEVFVPEALRIESAERGVSTTFPSTVHGPSGEVYDIVCADMLLPDLEVGDWLVFDRMGAYTLSIAARSGQPPVRYVL